ncbi:MAG: putative immunity protein [Candidatus Pacearchaeota archaeon]
MSYIKYLTEKTSLFENEMETKDVNLDTAIFVTKLAIADSAIDIFEKEFPEDKRPRDAIKTAREYLLNKDDATARAAVDAAADAAADAAREVAAYAVCAADPARVNDAADAVAYVSRLMRIIQKS